MITYYKRDKFLWETKEDYTPGYDNEEYKELNQKSFLGWCIRNCKIKSFGTFNSFIYHDKDSFFASEEFKIAFGAALCWAKKRGYQKIDRYKVAMDSSLGDLFEKEGFKLLNKGTTFAYKEENNKVIFSIVFKVKDGENNRIICINKKFAVVKLLRKVDSLNTINNMRLTNILDNEDSSFNKYYDYLNVLQDEWQNITTESRLLSLSIYTHSSEGFIDTAKKVGKKILDGIIFVVKTIISYIIRFISIVANFIKNIIFPKIFPRKNGKEITELYGFYSNMHFSAEDNIDSKGKKVLSDKAWGEIFYTKFDLENYSKLERIAAQTKVAVDTIYQSMKLASSENVFLRVLGPQYGNLFEENIAKFGSPDEPDDVIVDSLEFYHERNFIHFIYAIDKLTNGNIGSLIVKDKDNPDGFERKIKLGEEMYSGSNVARSIICNKPLDKIYIEMKNNNIQRDKIPIKDLVSVDLLENLYSQDKSYFKQIENENKIILDISKKLQSMSEEFYSKLEVIRNDVISKKKIIPNYVNINEFQQWISFLFEFTNTFFNYRINMIKTVKLVMRKLERTHVEINSIKPGTFASRIGRITVYQKDEFEKLDSRTLNQLSKEIMNKTLRAYFYRNKFPVYLFAFEDALLYDVPNITDPRTSGFVFLMFSGPDISKNISSRLRNLFNSDNISGNQFEITKLINDYRNNFTKSKVDEILPDAIIILMDANIDKFRNISETEKYIINLISPSVYYYANIVHESMHAIQLSDFADNYNDVINMSSGYIRGTSIDRFIVKKRDENGKQNINKIYYNQAYYLNNMEAESMIEERNFILSIKRNVLIEKYFRFKYRKKLEFSYLI